MIYLESDLLYWSRLLAIPPQAREACERARAVVVAAHAVVDAAPSGRPLAICEIPAPLINALDVALSQPVRIYRANADRIQDALLAVRWLQARKLLNTTTGALSFMLIQAKAPKRVEAFFQAILDEDDSPAIRALLRWIRNLPARRRIGIEKSVPTVLKAWNAWVTGAKVELLHYKVGESFPDVLDGRNVIGGDGFDPAEPAILGLARPVEHDPLPRRHRRPTSPEGK